MRIHEDIGGSAPGRRRLEVLNKSAVVLITAFWEAYCEDLAAEALKHLVDNSSDPDVLPLDLKKQVARDLEQDDHELAVWDLADNGWRDVLVENLEALRNDRNRRLNTPKTGQINELFFKAVGIRRVSDSWRWQGMSAPQAARKLDRFIELRGSIAHRGAAARAVHKSQVVDYYRHTKLLVSKTGGRVNRFVRTATGVKLW